ncbi:hypothetical protein V474_08095 [Novosphingobium barchaimii LL02]|uniref:Uncharacterized protein n=1 Tax=Novosphingobium barchaimii LL02 TaxID=1114963 RepID=A0A0J7Y7X1_9SPHN|nr:hypothetical protein V474_08095 [Novosphingobium barchaimii LL02]
MAKAVTDTARTPKLEGGEAIPTAGANKDGHCAKAGREVPPRVIASLTSSVNTGRVRTAIRNR